MRTRSWSQRAAARGSRLTLAQNIKAALALSAVILCLIVVGLLFPTVSIGPSDAPKARAKNDVVQIKTAMQAFLVEYGQLPTGNNSTLIRVLQGENAKRIVFFEPPLKQISKEGAFVDPWGVPYSFGRSASRYLWAYSSGKNKIDEGGHGDDINSWD